MDESTENLLKEDSSVGDSLSKALQNNMEVDDQMISREETEEIPGGFVQIITPLVNLPALETPQSEEGEEEEELEDTTDFDPWAFHLFLFLILFVVLRPFFLFQVLFHQITAPPDARHVGSV